MTHETPPQPEPLTADHLTTQLQETGLATVGPDQLAELGVALHNIGVSWFTVTLDAARSAPLDVDAKAAALIEHANRAEAAAIALRDQRLVERWRGVAEGVAELAARLRATPPAGARTTPNRSGRSRSTPPPREGPTQRPVPARAHTHPGATR